MDAGYIGYKSLSFYFDVELCASFEGIIHKFHVHVFCPCFMFDWDFVAFRNIIQHSLACDNATVPNKSPPTNNIHVVCHPNLQFQRILVIITCG